MQDRELWETAGGGSTCPTTEEREELRRLRRENKPLKIEREIPKKSRGLTNALRRCPARETDSVPPKLMSS